MSTTRSIKISNDEMIYVAKEAAIQNRSIGGQAEHWIRIGRAIETSPQFNYDNVRKALQASVSIDDLSLEESELYHEELSASFKIDDAKEQKPLDSKKHTADGNFTGLDEEGRLWGYNDTGEFGIVQTA